MRHCCNH